VSTDGRLLFWDVRKLSETTDECQLTDGGNAGDPMHAAKPNIDTRGCPALEAPLPCFARSSSCIHRDRTNLYKTVLARSWWHCGKACHSATRCEYWTFRHHQRKCYLLKSCCIREKQGYQSGSQFCPGDGGAPKITCPSSSPTIEEKGGTLLEGNTGVLVSHTGYPTVNYTNDIREHWEIRVPHGKTIKLTFTSFSLEDSYDYLMINWGSCYTGRWDEFLTGDHSQLIRTAPEGQNSVWLYFFTDDYLPSPQAKYSKLNFVSHL